jgi:SAM-dependent methyltransferase
MECALCRPARASISGDQTLIKRVSALDDIDKDAFSTLHPLELSTAITLIKNGIPHSVIPQIWADLGAGSGLFTKALSTLLPDGSTIYAIDQETKALNNIAPLSGEILLKKMTLDFVDDPIVTEPLDGVLMANALHFVRDKPAFMGKIRQAIKPSAKILIVEYDRDTPNPWVPYPVSYQSLQRLADEVGLAFISKIGSTPSKYHGANIYSAILSVRF